MRSAGAGGAADAGVGMGGSPLCWLAWWEAEIFGGISEDVGGQGEMRGVRRAGVPVKRGEPRSREGGRTGCDDGLRLRSGPGLRAPWRPVVGRKSAFLGAIAGILGSDPR